MLAMLLFESVAQSGRAAENAWHNSRKGRWFESILTHVLSDFLSYPGRTIADLDNVQCGSGLKVIVSIV